MSREARDRVWNKSQQEGSRMVVMLALAEFADKSGLCFPGDEELAKRCRMKERNMQYVLKELEGSGEILKIRRPGRGLRSYTLVTVGLSTRRIYAALRRNNYPDLDIDKNTAKRLINDWLKGAEDCTNTKKVQSAKRCNVASEKVQSDAEKVQSSVEKGAIQRPPYKEEPSGTVIEPSGNRHMGASAPGARKNEYVKCSGCKQDVPVRADANRGGAPTAPCLTCGVDVLAQVLAADLSEDELKADAARCLRFYGHVFAEQFNRRPHITKGKDFGIILGLVKEYGKETVQGFIGKYVRLRDEKLEEVGYPVSWLPSRINAIIVNGNGGRQMPVKAQRTSANLQSFRNGGSQS